MQLNLAQQLAAEVVERLAPFCTRIEVAGSIRRRKPECRDIDIVLITRDPWGLNQELRQLGMISAAGAKLQRLTYKDVQVDIYFATPAIWATLLLIRTGSVGNNIRLCSLAKSKGLKLHADGSGLFRMEVQGCDGKEVRIAGDTEESIYRTLGVPFQKPEERV